MTHVIAFPVYNLFYLLPLISAFVFGYYEGGIGFLQMYPPTILLHICYIYASGIIAFLLGTLLIRLISINSPKPAHIRQAQDIAPDFFLKLCTALLSLLYLGTKLYLIPDGVYSSYAFDTGKMASPIWTLSMFLSEAIVAISIVFLTSSGKNDRLWYYFLNSILLINLLHGTRIFFIITILIYFCWMFHSGKLKLNIRIVLRLLALFLFIALFFYLLFMYRSNVQFSRESFSLEKIISPIIYESVFSQISLLRTLEYDLIDKEIEAFRLYTDTLIFITPRFIIPEKDSLMLLSELAKKGYVLSPLGACNGYAAAIVYLGYLFPFLYFLLGMFTAFLCRISVYSRYFEIIYIYFVADILFRFVRDGLIIPSKMMFNNLIMLALLCILSNMFRPIFQKKPI